VGNWRTDSDGPMRVVSGGMSRERIHFEAPPANRVSENMNTLLKWIESTSEDAVIQSAVVHLWFLSIHPFEDGNGRIARALSDLLHQSPRRFYSLSNQIEKERKEYYRQLEIVQQGTLDISSWINWYFECLEKSLHESEVLLQKILVRSQFWLHHQNTILNTRQKKNASIVVG
jgi:Fic family protein